MKRLFYRPILLTALAAAVILLAAGVALGSATVKNLRRLEIIEARFQHAQRFQETGLRLQAALIAELTGDPPLDRRRLEELRRAVVALQQPHLLGERSTAEGLRAVDLLLSDLERSPGEALLAAVGVFRDVLSAERTAQLDLIHRLHRDTRTELWVSTGVLASLVLLSAVAAFSLRRRVLGPLTDLRGLLGRMGEGELSPITTQGADPVVAPLLANYNRMVTRLAELEEARRSHTRTLEQEVRTATRALLEQQQSLARAERLAAAGETAAAIAHELRNPLSGVQMVLTNLRRETSDPDQQARLGSAVAELERVSRLLASLLQEARHTPEPARPVTVAATVEDLLALLRYQVPAAVALDRDLPPDLVARLPEGRFRQALMNLVLNAAQALGEEGGKVVVRARREGTELVLAVLDDGPGFPPELLRNGVGPFHSRRPGGTGLGLALVRRFARDLGGELELANREGGGARVTLRLPVGGEDDG